MLVDSGRKAEPSGRNPDGLRRLGPAARSLLQEHKLKEEDVTPTGPLGMITKGDVLKAVKSRKSPDTHKEKVRMPILLIQGATQRVCRRDTLSIQCCTLHDYARLLKSIGQPPFTFVEAVGTKLC